MPKPPARVDNRKAKSLDPGALKCAIDFLRTSEETVPAFVVSPQIEEHTHWPMG